MGDINLVKEDEVPLISDSEFNRDYAKHPRKETRACLRALKSNPSQNGSCSGHSGWLFKKQSNSNSFKKYWVQLDCDACALYYSSSEKSKGTKVKIGYATCENLNVPDNLAAIQFEKANSFCRYRLKIWTSKKQHTFGAESDEEFEHWRSAINDLLRARYSDSELDDKQNAINRLRPLVEAQEALQVERYVYLRRVLSETGMVPGSGPLKLRQGNLKVLLKDRDSFAPMFIILHPQFLNIFDLNDKKYPITVLALKYLVAIEKKNSTKTFTVITPLHTITFRAKHEVAAREWISAIEQASSAKNPNTTASNNNDNEAGPSFGGTPVLVYHTNSLFGSKRHSFHMKGNIATIGRASSNSLSVEDIRISRSHAKIELTSSNSLIFSDLGSAYGSKVNDSEVTRTPLSVGDRIQMGSTVFTVESR